MSAEDQSGDGSRYDGRYHGDEQDERRYVGKQLLHRKDHTGKRGIECGRQSGACTTRNQIVAFSAGITQSVAKALGDTGAELD